MPDAVLASDSRRCSVCQTVLPRIAVDVIEHLAKHGIACTEGEAHRLLNRHLKSPDPKRPPEEKLPFNPEIPSQLGRSR